MQVDRYFIVFHSNPLILMFSILQYIIDVLNLLPFHELNLLIEMFGAVTSTRWSSESCSNYQFTGMCEMVTSFTQYETFTN